MIHLLLFIRASLWVFWNAGRFLALPICIHLPQLIDRTPTLMGITHAPVMAHVWPQNFCEIESRESGMRRTG
jgi:hypothetical protein